MTTEQQQREACAELAKAMGWTPPTLYDAPWPERFFYWLSPDGQSSQEDAPDYFTDPAASRELVTWLAAQDVSLQSVFEEKLRELLTEMYAPILRQPSTIDYLTAPLPVIARAACKALGIEVSE